MTPESMRTQLRNWGEIVILTALYFVSGKIGLGMAFIHPSVTAVWPPTGIALAAFLLRGNRIWPGVLLGAFLVHITTAGSLLNAIGITAGNTLEAYAGAYLVRTYANGVNAFDRPKDFLNFVIVAVMPSTMISATFGAASLCFSGISDWRNYGPIWLTWWLGDATSDVVVAPLLLLCSVRRPWRWTIPRALEGMILMLILIMVGQGIFSNFLPFGGGHYPLEFASIPIILWAAFRFDQREISVGMFILSFFAVWGTMHNYGPFITDSAEQSIVLAQVFVGFMGIMALTTGAVVSERSKLTRDLQETLDHVKTLSGLLPICSWCKKIRNDGGYWQEVEGYIHEHSDAAFTHGVCPDCLEKYKSEFIKKRTG
jgi:integral membrane sensor domain MASE1